MKCLSFQHTFMSSFTLPSKSGKIPATYRRLKNELQNIHNLTSLLYHEYQDGQNLENRLETASLDCEKSQA